MKILRFIVIIVVLVGLVGLVGNYNNQASAYTLEELVGNYTMSEYMRINPYNGCIIENCDDYWECTGTLSIDGSNIRYTMTTNGSTQVVSGTWVFDNPYQITLHLTNLAGVSTVIIGLGCNSDGLLTSMEFNGAYETYAWHKTSPSNITTINTNDTDQDGVIDEWDNCPNTPDGSLTDRYGCKQQASCIPATLSPELKIHLSNLQFNTGSGIVDLWADFEYAGESDGNFLWKLTNFGEK